MVKALHKQFTEKQKNKNKKTPTSMKSSNFTRK